MAIVSGNIGQIIPFDVTQAGAVTGVYFGTGLSQNIKAQSNNTTILAKVPDEANWGYVYFHKRPQTSIYNITETGYKQTGAYSSLNNRVIASGFSPACTSGTISYSNVYDATTICNLNGTGTTEALASGMLYNAYGSGYCGDAGEYTNSGYTEVQTRLNNFRTFSDDDGNWLAIGTVQDTGNFVYKKASVDVTCTAPIVDNTSYKFVPIPLITSFSPKEGSKNEPLNIYGKALKDVSSASINNSGISFQVINNTHLSGSIPTGVFNHKVKLVGPSGVISNSIELFSTFTASQSAARTKALSLTPGQSTQRTKGDSIFVSLDGQDITGLSTATLTDKNNNVTNLLNDSNFTHTETSLSIQPSGLNAGVYDIALQGTYGSASLDDVITIIGTPIVKGSEITIMSTGLINEPTVYSDLNTLQTQKYNAQWPFSLDKEPDKICLTFENSGVQTAKTASFRLGYNHGRNFNNIEEYYIKASGLTSTASMDRALAKYNSGIYTTDEYGDPFDSYSYKLQPCLCDITYSGAALFNKAHSFYRSGILTGLINGNTGTHPLVTGLKSGCVDDYNQYTSQHATKASCAKSGFLYSTDLLFDYNSQVNLTATGYSTGITIANIEQQIVNSYPGYGVSSYVHSGRDYREADTFSSGISYPIDTSIFSNYTHPYWENIRLSGMNTLYPNGYPGGKNLTTAYNYSNSSNLIYNTTLTGVGKTSTESISAIETQRLLNYSQCTTGTYSGQASYISETPFVTGRTYGFCTGDGMDTHAEVNGCSFSSYMTGILTGLIHNENERLHGEYGGDYTITSYSIATGVQTGNFIGCELVATGLTSGDAISRRNDLSSGYFWRGECVNDNEGGLLRTENVSNNRPNFGMDVPFAEEIAIDEWESRITGFFDKRYYVHYHPVVSVPQHKSTAHVSCPNTNFNVVLERDEENWTTTGNAYKKDIRRMNVTLKANCSGYETNLTTRCNRITAGIEWYCPKPFTNTINACWEDDFEKGNYLINYTSGAYELANNKWFIGTGNLNATQII